MNTKWTRADLAAYEARRKTSSPKPKPFVCPQPLATQKGEASDTASVPRRIVRIASFRRRLLDFDNLAGGCKYFLDCCKYAQLIPDDRPQDIILEVRQEKVNTKQEERTEIEIELPSL